MDLRKEDLPATIQAFDLEDDKEIFIAEQVVNSQSDVETFTNRYTGKLIKAKLVIPVGNNKSYGNQVYKKKSSSNGLIIIIFILILTALVIYGFSTGWIQEKFNLKI